MRVIGRRVEKPVTFEASGLLLAEGARLNDEIHKLPSGQTTCVPKGIMRFKSHEHANEYALTCLSHAIAKTAKELERAIEVIRQNQLDDDHLSSKQT